MIKQRFDKQHKNKTIKKFLFSFDYFSFVLRLYIIYISVENCLEIIQARLLFDESYKIEIEFGIWFSCENIVSILDEKSAE